MTASIEPIDGGGIATIVVKLQGLWHATERSERLPLVCVGRPWINAQDTATAVPLDDRGCLSCARCLRELSGVVWLIRTAAGFISSVVGGMRVESPVDGAGLLLEGVAGWPQKKMAQAWLDKNSVDGEIVRAREL